MGLEVIGNQSLASFNTLRLPVSAEYFARIDSEADLAEALEWARSHDHDLTVLGSGSNVVLTRDLGGLTLVMNIPGVTTTDTGLAIGAGENWHATVERSLLDGWYGLENLALIPGTVGAAPIQNIGAYGVELSEVVHSVDALDRATGSRVTFPAADCRFGYRDSLFKNQARDQFVIVRVNLTLLRQFRPRLEYAELARRLTNDQDIDAWTVFRTVCEIRASKLPDPEETGNVGSFFKNPIVDRQKLEQLRAKWPDLPAWESGTEVKLAAGWLIERCGLKGERVGGAAVSERHALVLVNRGGASPEDVVALSEQIRARVEATFEVALDPEPRFY